MEQKKKNNLQKLKEKARLEYEETIKSGGEIVEVEDEELKQLTPKQLIFVEEYVKTKNGTDAAISAGYAEGSAHVQSNRMLNMPHVQAEIQKRYEKISNIFMIEKIDIIRDLIEYNRKALDGQITETAGLRALDLINKMLGFYEPEKIVMDSKQISINYIIPEKED